MRGASLGALLAALAGCTPDRDPSELFAPEDVNVLVIDAVLIVDREISDLKLSRTLAPDVPFSMEAAGVVGAEISISWGAETIFYTDQPGRPGSYRPEIRGVAVLPETEYLLTAETAGGEILTASTVTPARFGVDSWALLTADGSSELRRLRTFVEAGDSVYYRPENQVVYTEGLIEAQFAAGGAGEFGAAGYQLALASIDLDSDFVIEPPFFEDEDYEDLTRTGSSPILTAADGRVRLPWFGVFFEGRYLYQVFAVDSNWFDLVRSRPQQDGGLGFGGNAGDSPGRPIFNVNGGFGLFGSASVDSVGFFVLPAP